MRFTLVRLTAQLERDSRLQLKLARVAAEKLVIMAEVGVPRDQEGAIDGGGRIRADVVDIPPDELRVVEQIEGLDADFEANPFGEVQALHERGIEVIDVTERKCVPPRVGTGT